MRKFLFLSVLFYLLPFFISPISYCHANNSNVELEWDYLTHVHFADRYIDTASLHVLKNVSVTKNRSIYKGLTITRPYGYIIDDKYEKKDSSAIGAGPIYMIRFREQHSKHLSNSLDISGGIILYDKAFPAEGRCYNFMWRIGPKFIYKFDENSLITIGYTFMHVSNGFRTHNPGYNGHGLSVSLTTSF